MRTINLNSKLIIILLIIYGLLTIDYRLTYAQSGPAKLTVPGDVTCESIILEPQASKTLPCQEGQVYFDNNTNQPYYCDGTNWVSFGGGGENVTVGSRIVAAWNSLGSTVDGSPPIGNPCTNCCAGDGTACINPKADKTCTGVNDHQKIYNAITDLIPGGGAVYLLEGTYNISSPLVLENNVSLIGAGKATILKALGNINVIDSIAGQTGLLISQLTIDGNNAANAGINFDTVSGSKINKVWIENANIGISLSSSNYNNISNITLSDDSANTGIQLSGSSNNMISNSYIYTNYTGVNLISSSNNNKISGNSIYAVKKGAGQCMGIQNSVNNIISGNYIENTGVSSNLGIRVASLSNTNKISGNRILKAGIYLESGSEYNSIANNIISESIDGIYVGTSENNVSQNIISSNSGIRIEDSVSSAWHNLISSNLIKRFTSYGIIITNDGSGFVPFYNYLVGNLITGGPAERKIYELMIPSGSASVKNAYTDKAEISFRADLNEIIDPDYGTLNPGTSSYRVLSSDHGGAVNGIVDGKYPGDILILENAPYYQFDTIWVANNNNTKLRGRTSKELWGTDIITLIWNGADWIQTGGKEY